MGIFTSHVMAVTMEMLVVFLDQDVKLWLPHP